LPKSAGNLRSAIKIDLRTQFRRRRRWDFRSRPKNTLSLNK
jgi:hypothetical protein